MKRGNLVKRGEWRPIKGGLIWTTPLHSAAASMLVRYRAGETLAEIGLDHGITRERVRQILAKLGVSRSDGGITTRAKRSRVARQSAKDAASLAKHGCIYAEYRKLVMAGATRPYQYQRRSAGYRGIEWKFTLASWWAFWQASGRWSERGIGKGRYCMARHGDVGAYEPGNVSIKLCEDNGREYQALRAKHERRRSLPKGVYLALPGYAKPYMARHGKLHIGMYATAGEAIAAKRAHLDSLSQPREQEAA